jgi:hypothetical protein|tara:strand:+ start:154 stop:345 length:192 start_codon:yes stop_codon:yes gene_type:complete
MLSNRPFIITYYSDKDKKTITRNAIHTEGCEYKTSKADRPMYVYWDLDSKGYRTATDSWSVRF